MLAPLIRENGIDVRDDTRIAAGAEWRNEIKRAIDHAKVALLLVSPSYLASKFIVEEELPLLLEAARREGLIILWVLISPCLYNKTPITEFQAAYSISRPLEKLSSSHRNQALLEIAEVVASALQENRVPRRRAL